MSDQAPRYPKRLIEVDLPIARISAHARREKSIRHGHISTLHIWWARRPLAACRAVICAALWPDPADELCPLRFRADAFRTLEELRKRVLEGGLSTDQRAAVTPVSRIAFPKDEADLLGLRKALLNFIAEFANWDFSTNKFFLEASRALTQSAHEALGGEAGTRPLVVDPFAGGGSIPLEALRVGADAFASDLNPVPVLLNKVVLEYIPRYGQRLADEVRKWGDWIKDKAEKELAGFYPKDSDGATPIAYIWARTVRCEGPGCGIEVPLIRSLWIARKGRRSVALKLRASIDNKEVAIEVVHNPSTKDVSDGTVKRGSATCPVCGFTTPVDSVRRQLRSRHGGAADARLLCVVTSGAMDGERGYRTETEQDRAVLLRVRQNLDKRTDLGLGPLTVVPDEKLDVRGIRHTWAMIYGIESWGDLFTPRQALSLSVFAKLVRETTQQPELAQQRELAAAVQTCLAFSLDKCADYWSSASTWMPRETVRDTFARQALPLTWDFVEANPIADFHCAWAEAYEWVEAVCRTEAASAKHPGQVERASAVSCPLPTDSVDAFITDPPYYDAVPYSYLSDFFYVWLRRSLSNVHDSILREPTVPKDDEIVVDRPHELSDSKKDVDFYERELTRAFSDGRRVSRPGAIGTIVFASKTTASWEAILQAVIDAGWVVTASWPIDTEREARVSAQGQARLGSSVHLVCRPRETHDGSLREHDIGDWRDTLSELPGRIRDWMPRLAAEGIVGADAIFACLGPALEIFSRYSRVEKSNGDVVPLREFLEHVWAAVSNEALSMIFQDADAAALEPDARLTAMWLWTLSTVMPESNGENSDDEEVTTEDEDDESRPTKVAGFVLEFDAARKIAQGLGIHLERIPSVVEVKGDKARLLPVAERTKYLFGKEAAEPATAKKKSKKKDDQLSLFAALQEADAETAFEQPEFKALKPGSTALDRVHQAMILFAAGRGEALKRFLVEEGAGKDARFWKLAQSLSALYPAGIDEKRWVDGVLARKKSLGL